MARRNGNGRGKQKSNRLVGWLVSYEVDEQGHAHEVRAGRTLIGSDKCPGERVITLAEKGISAPHSALNASPKHRVLIQDIFSDAGSYICRSGSDNEEKITGPIEMQHGDWLRIGDHTRFQLCLIDASNR